MTTEQANQATEQQKYRFFITDLFRELSSVVDSSYPSVCPTIRLHSVMELVELEIKSEMMRSVDCPHCSEDED